MRITYLLLFICGAWIGVHVEQRERSVAANIARKQNSIAKADLGLGDVNQRLSDAADRHDIAVTEDRKLCDESEFLGLYTAGRKHIVLCMDKIRSISGHGLDHREVLQRVFAHELVHAAQDCQSRAGRPPSLGLPESELRSLPQEALDGVEHSLRINGASKLPRSMRWRQEAEAQALEGNPSAVIAALDAVCSA
jgi:hypothetical protein